MTRTSHADKLRALGYDEGPAEVRRFQQDFNRMDPERLLAITGELDRATLAALAVAYDARALLAITRERGER